METPAVQNGIEYTTFYLTFIGEYLQMHGSFVVGDNQAVATFEGYLLDEDTDYYFLGLNGESVTTAIKKSSVYSIQIVRQDDPVRNLLDSIPVPEDETGHN